jgi:hypothetical protein
MRTGFPFSSIATRFERWGVLKPVEAFDRHCAQIFRIGADPIGCFLPMRVLHRPDQVATAPTPDAPIRMARASILSVSDASTGTASLSEQVLPDFESLPCASSAGTRDDLMDSSPTRSDLRC